MLGKDILKILDEAFNSIEGEDSKNKILFGVVNQDGRVKRKENLAIWTQISDAVNEIYFRESKYKKKLGISIPYYLDEEYISWQKISGIEYRPKRRTITVFRDVKWKSSKFQSHYVCYLKTYKLETDDGGNQLFEELKLKKLKRLEDQLNKTLEKLGRIDSEIEKVNTSSL